MLGILFAQSSAILQAIQHILNKKFVKNEKPFVVIWFTIFLSMFFLIPTVIIDGIPELNEKFYLFLVLRLILDTFALTLYFYAIKHGDISLVVPLSTFSVVFSLTASSILNKEFPNYLGIIGIFTIVFGTYLLNLPKENRRKDLFLPFKLLFKDLAAKLILTSAALYGIIYAINKVGIENSSTSFFTFSAALGLLIIFTIVNIYQSKGQFYKQLTPKMFSRFLPIGLVDGVKIFTFMMAISYTFVAFADASDNTSAIYSTIFAGIFFKEKIKERIFPIVIMIVGVLFITMSTYLG